MKPGTRIELLRHGDTGQRSYRGQLDDALTDAGWSQLRAAVADRDWDAVVSSTLQRCALFAAELARMTGGRVEVSQHTRLHELGELTPHAVALQRFVLADGNAERLGARLDGIGLAAGSVGWTVDRQNLVAALAQAVQHLFGKGRLADQNDAHRAGAVHFRCWPKNFSRRCQASVAASALYEARSLQKNP